MTRAWSSSSPPIRIEVSETMPERAMDLGGAATDVDHHVAGRRLDRQPDTDRGGHRFGHHEHLLGTGGLGRIAHGTAFDFGDAGRDRHDHLRLHAEHVLVDDRLQEVAQHLLGHIEVGDHAVLEWPHRQDALGCPSEHPLRLETDPLDASGRLLDRNNGGFVEHDPFTLHVDEGVRGAEIDGDLVGREKRAELEEFHRQ